jgi:hypothetical protein
MRINIVKPCAEDWHEMTPIEQGRFCGSCNKTVVDFSNWSRNDIIHYFKAINSKKICGRFQKSDLHTELILNEVHVFANKPTITTKNRPSALFLMTVGMLLMYSCNNSIEIPAATENITHNSNENADQTSTSNDSIAKNEKSTVSSKKAEKPIDKSAQNIGNTDVSGSNPNTSFPNAHSAKIPNPEIMMMGEPILEYPEIEASFPGGFDALHRFLVKNIDYSKCEENEKILVRFSVQADGEISDIVIIRGSNAANITEVKRVISAMPNWIPAQYIGQSVESKVTIPIIINSR